MADAVNPFGPQGSKGPDRATDPSGAGDDDRATWKVRRERAVWYGVVGVGLMFASGLSPAFGVGGALMAIFGIAEYIRWTLKRPKDEDPWRDHEIDAWEEQHYGEGDGLDASDEADAPDVVESNPDEAFGLHDKRF